MVPRGAKMCYLLTIGVKETKSCQGVPKGVKSHQGVLRAAKGYRGVFIVGSVAEVFGGRKKDDDGHGGRSGGCSDEYWKVRASVVL